MDVLSTLNQLAATIQLSREGTGQVRPGNIVVIHLLPKLDGEDIATIVPGVVSAVWLVKNVRFADAAPAAANVDLLTYLTNAANVIGGVPIADVQLPIDAPPLQGACPPVTNVVADV